MAARDQQPIIQGLQLSMQRKAKALAGTLQPQPGRPDCEILAAQGEGALTGHFWSSVGLRHGTHQMWCVGRIASTGVNEITCESRVFTDDPGGCPVLLLQGVRAEIQCAIQFHLDGLASDGQGAPVSSSSVEMVSV